VKASLGWRHLAADHHRGQQSVHRPLPQVHVSSIIDAATYRCRVRRERHFTVLSLCKAWYLLGIKIRIFMNYKYKVSQNGQILSLGAPD